MMGKMRSLLLMKSVLWYGLISSYYTYRYCIFIPKKNSKSISSLLFKMSFSFIDNYQITMCSVYIIFQFQVENSSTYKNLSHEQFQMLVTEWIINTNYKTISKKRKNDYNALIVK